MTEEIANRLWYVRRNGVVSGPFPAGIISSYLLLGRLHDDDEVGPDRISWRPVSFYPELIPEALSLPEGPERNEKIFQARLREDERLRERRRERAGADGAARGGRDRRTGESAAFTTHRSNLAALLASLPESVENNRYRPWVVAAAVLLTALMLVIWFVSLQESAPPPPDCDALGGPGVNWSYCRKPGLAADSADLRGARLNNTVLYRSDLRNASLADAELNYADLRLADLRGADFTGARMVGANLAEARMGRTVLIGADLTYANLQGVYVANSDFSGALLDHAVWTDGRICGVGSVGICR